MAEQRKTIKGEVFMSGGRAVLNGGIAGGAIGFNLGLYCANHMGQASAGHEAACVAGLTGLGFGIGAIYGNGNALAKTITIVALGALCGAGIGIAAAGPLCSGVVVGWSSAAFGGGVAGATAGATVTIAKRWLENRHKETETHKQHLKTV